MTRAEAVRLVAALGAVEMCLVRKDRVSGPLLAQAQRAAAGTAAGPYVDAAAALSRQRDLFADENAAARKVAQALCRAAAQAAQAAALASAAARG